ncbi:MAG: hypothetical protein AAGI92_03870 [Pseudomonadota bacterium]
MTKTLNSAMWVTSTALVYATILIGASFSAEILINSGAIAVQLVLAAAMLSLLVRAKSQTAELYNRISAVRRTLTDKELRTHVAWLSSRPNSR